MRPRRYCALITLALCFALAPAAARADSPDVQIDGYDRTGAGSVVVSSSIDPNGLTTSVHFEYALVASPFCVGGGASDQAHATSSMQVVGAAVGIQSLKTTISGLTGGQTYCLKLVADNGTVSESFFSALVPGLPDTTTSGVNSNGPGSITVRGLVDANGQPTTATVRYDTDISWFCQHGGSGGTPTTAAIAVDAGSAEGAVPVSVTLPVLGPGQHLCVQIVATNASGFGSSPDARPIVVGAAELTAQRLEGLGPETSRSIASITTVDQPATVHVEYAISGPVSSQFCSTQGESGDPQSTPDQQLVAATAPQTLVTTLGPYGSTGDRCFVYVLSNASATVRIFGGTFHAGGPQLSTLAATNVTGTSATLHATANPGGSTALAHFELGLEGTAFCGSEGVEGAPSLLSDELALGGGLDVVARRFMSRSRASSRSPPTASAPSRRTRAGRRTAHRSRSPPGPPAGGGRWRRRERGHARALGTGHPGARREARQALRLTPCDEGPVRRAAREGALHRAARIDAFDAAGRASLENRLAGTLRRSKVSGTVSATISLSSRTRRRLARTRTAKLELIVVVTPAGGKPVTRKLVVSLRRAR